MDQNFDAIQYSAMRKLHVLGVYASNVDGSDHDSSHWSCDKFAELNIGGPIGCVNTGTHIIEPGKLVVMIPPTLAQLKIRVNKAVTRMQTTYPPNEGFIVPMTCTLTDVVLDQLYQMFIYDTYPVIHGMAYAETSFSLWLSKRIIGYAGPERASPGESFVLVVQKAMPCIQKISEFGFIHGQPAPSAPSFDPSTSAHTSYTPQTPRQTAPTKGVSSGYYELFQIFKKFQTVEIMFETVIDNLSATELPTIVVDNFKTIIRGFSELTDIMKETKTEIDKHLQQKGSMQTTSKAKGKESEVKQTSEAKEKGPEVIKSVKPKSKKAKAKVEEKITEANVNEIPEEFQHLIDDDDKLDEMEEATML